MHRLPFCDRTTARLETTVFASLSLAAVVMVVLAASQVTGAVARRSGPGAARAGWTTSSAVSPTNNDDVQPAATSHQFNRSSEARPVPSARAISLERSNRGPGLGLLRH